MRITYTNKVGPGQYLSFGFNIKAGGSVLYYLLGGIIAMGLLAVAIIYPEIFDIIFSPITLFFGWIDQFVINKV